MLKTKNTELQSVLDYLSSQPDVVQVDETVDATTPLYKQYVRTCVTSHGPAAQSRVHDRHN